MLWKEQMHWRQVQYTVHINIHDRINLQAMLSVNHVHTHTHTDMQEKSETKHKKGVWMWHYHPYDGDKAQISYCAYET